MVDIFDEVQDDLRAERAARLLKKFGWLIIILILAVIAAAIGWQLWTRAQNQQDAAVATRYVAALNAIEQAPAINTAARTAQIDPLVQLAADAPDGYRTLARLRAAGLKADAGDLPGAIALWNAVVTDQAADPLLRDLASLLATGRQLEQGDPSQIEARLQPLAQPGNAWAALANEQLALLDLRQGKTADAKAKLHALSIDIDAPSGLRARAAALLAGMG